MTMLSTILFAIFVVLALVSVVVIVLAVYVVLQDEYAGVEWFAIVGALALHTLAYSLAANTVAQWLH